MRGGLFRRMSDGASLMHSMESIQLNLPLCDLRQADAYQPRPPRKRTCLNGKLVYDEDGLPVGNVSKRVASLFASSTAFAGRPNR
jgi:hypothetical protein